MKYFLNTEYGQPDAEDAKVTQRTQKEYQINFKNSVEAISQNNFSYFFLYLLLRPLRNLCVLCVQNLPYSFRTASPL